MEVLERRDQMASLVLGVQVWTEVNGGKGSKVPATTIAGQQTFVLTRGSSYLLQVTAEDQRTSTPNVPAAGVIALSLNTAWNAGFSNVVYTGAANDPRLVTERFDLITERFIKVDTAANTATTQGAALPKLPVGSIFRGNPIGDSQCQAGTDPTDDGKDSCREFSLYSFRASVVGTSDFTVNLGTNGMSFADAAVLEDVNGISTREELVAGDELRVGLEVVDPPTTASGSISGFVYADSDNNGILSRDTTGAPTEIGLPNVSLTIFQDVATGPLATVTTGPDGWYQFVNLPEGTYTLQQTQPLNFVSRASNLGVVLPGRVAAGTAMIDEIREIVIDGGEHAVDYNFGEVLSAGAITKRLWLGSAPPKEVQAASFLGVVANWMSTSSANDAIAVTRSNATFEIAVNGQPAIVKGPKSATLLVVDASQGQDTATLGGGVATELSHAQPGQVSLRNAELPLGVPGGYGVLVVGATSNRFEAVASAQTTIVLEDSPSNDAVTASVKRLELVYGGSNRAVVAEDFDEVRLVSRAGGVDRLDQRAVDYLLELAGSWN